MTLAELKPGEQALVLDLSGDSALIQRLCEFGIFEGSLVQTLNVAPLGDPLEILIGDTHLSLRKSEAAAVLIDPATVQISTDFDK